MNAARIATSIIILSLWILSLHAQNVVSRDLDTIRIEALKIDRSDTFTDTLTDQLTENTESALLVNSGAYIRNYAPGQSSTMQIMGATSNQSNVLWKGIQISNPMLGVSDISLLSLSLFDESHILYITSLEQMTIGGQVSLENRAPLKQSLGITYRYNSMQNHKVLGFWAEARKNYSHKISWSGLSAKNHYKVDLGGSTYNMQYARQNTGQAIYDGYFQARKWLIQPSLWHIQSFREIPASFGGNGNNDVQYDRQFRSQLALERSFQNLDFKQQFAYLNDEIRFTNNFVDDLGVAHNFISQSTSDLKISKKLSLDSWWQVKSTKGSHPSFSESASPLLQSNFVNTLKFHHKNYHFNIGGSYIFQNVFSQKHSFLPLIELKYKSQKQSFHLQFQRALRFPTLNDLYWSPGGNDNLLPEDALKFTGGYGIRIGAINLRSLVYYRETKNLIQWVPLGSFWGPENVAQVQSYGAQFILDYKLYLTTKLALNLSQQYYYNRSVNANSSSPFFKKQLIYTPLHKITSSIVLDGVKWKWEGSGIFSSARFTNQDNSQVLNPFFVLDSQFSYELLQKGDRKLIATIALQNITNTIYQHQAGFYQPQRQVEMGLSFKL